MQDEPQAEEAEDHEDHEGDREQGRAPPDEQEDVIMTKSINDVLSFPVEDLRITMGTVGPKERKEIETMVKIATLRKTPPCEAQRTPRAQTRQVRRGQGLGVAGVRASVNVSQWPAPCARVIVACATCALV